ncbi:nickel ABC transporter permease subunit NikB [Treponema pedis]|uniref:Nickel transport system permease protein NikB n=4 Tax=Treponema pedis TaxID=409322 RepID=S6A211_9SPIR|nr:nickel ABC transporter permease subunit NikB [Treponema pedis]AGT45023.1 nickel transport system permease protein NikB [Treponema pedis str. T A4]QOW60291.1 nickel ABC transporter permease subunit NikB [Treponema pedis]
MLKFIIKRLFFVVPIMLAVSVMIFAILRLNGTDAAMSYLNASGISPTDEALAEAKRVLNLDKPVWEQYKIWFKDALNLHFGKSYITGRDVTADMAYYLPATLKLAGFALVLTLAFSVPLGILSAVFKDKFIDYAVRFFSFLGVCTPNFWLGILLILLFSVHLKILPPFGIGGFSHLIMPAFTISFMSIAINSRLIRTNMLEIKNQRHVTYAKMRGIPRIRVLFSHIFRNASLPIITALGMHLGELVGGAMVVENVFAYPGVGRYAVEAIINNDYPVIQCFILVMAFVFVLSNLVIDVVYALIDPRIRAGVK